MHDVWQVADELVRHRKDDPQAGPWVDRLPSLALDLSREWGLRLDGPAMSGFMSAVWPVVNGHGRRLVLKLHGPWEGAGGEIPFLRAAAGPAVVELVRSDATRGAILLERLDPARTLDTHPDVDDACATIGDLVRSISTHEAEPTTRPLWHELDRLHASITAMLDRTPEVIPASLAQHALATLRHLAGSLRAQTDPQPLIHGDLHFQNVLHSLAGSPERWVAIDPLPAGGYPEWDVTASLRNRWPEAVATGDPDRALRRRVDIIGERAGLDRSLARSIAQAVACDNLLWLSRAAPDVHPVVRGFVPPYELVARWLT